MKRKIIEIDEAKCTGCGLCVPNCPEGAIRIIDGKARLLGDLFCDGLGACVGECPEGAITVLEREAEPYDESKVMENIVRQGEPVVRAHLEHLQSHGETRSVFRSEREARSFERASSETEYYKTALAVLEKKGLAVPAQAASEGTTRHEGCPGARAMSIANRGEARPAAAPQPSRLSTWPVQLHLLPPRAPFFKDRDLLLCADCVAYVAGDFHDRFLKDNVLAIACPKLDDGQEIYLEKLKAVIDEAGIRALTVLTMEVPCCSGLAGLAQEALAQTGHHKLPVSWLVINLKGDIIKRTLIQ